MMRQLRLLAAAACLTSSSARTIHEDIFAFPQYEITFANDFILQSDASKLSLHHHVTEDPSTPSPVPSPSDDVESYEPMMLGSTSYLCALPKARPTVDPAPAPPSAAEQEKEVARAAHRGGELLQRMEGHCIYYMSGWWSYSFCYNEEVKQFHALPPGRHGVPLWPPIEDPEVPAFILGEFDVAPAGDAPPPQPPAPRSARPRGVEGDGDGRADTNAERGLVVPRVTTRGDTRHMVQRLGGGTVCDITGRARRIDVQYRCDPASPADYIGHIKETSTCAYQMLVHTPRLCGDVAFRPPPTARAHAVVCQEVLAEDGVEGWHARQAARAKQNLIGDKAAAGAAGAAGGPDPEKGPPAAPAGPAKQFVGGIEVGGMRQVGRDGRRLEPPNFYSPAPYAVEVVASYHPQAHGGQVWKKPLQELRKLEVSVTTVNQMIDDLQQMAAGLPWKLELVDKPTGKELQGAVEEEEEDLEWEIRDEL